ncbi:hypothetical protein DC31_05825 [Microbacterium sp. CH12i]|uniref:hypothetical protein n=1 Tax=Microbacterium sp. CH12i TaxID=1479651 RepID=UPI000461E77D|nr:hypothetical protein [Microbacterium sp. CH12i]KDA04651.1 hypothetical protein DC31_05825 [Microbacterium sp. CH12i]
MTDITTTAPATGIEEGTLTFPGTPAVTDRRGAFAGELARAQAELADARAQIATRDQTIHQLRTEQITDGADARLLDFWDKAGRIADHADFCQEYDRLAEAMNGTPRNRDWEVEAEVTVTIRVNYSTSATTEDDADENARDGIDFDDVIAAYRDNGHEGFDVSIISTERV